MRPGISTSLRGAALLLVAACTEPVAPTRDLVITPTSAAIPLAQARQYGIPATFTNATALAVDLYSTSCLGGVITLERGVPGGWVPLPPPDVVCVAALLVTPGITVAAGASVGLVAPVHDAQSLTPGRYRMRVRTSGGDATSGVFKVT